MVIDVYKFFKDDPAYNKLVGNDYMILEYNCPIEIEKVQLFNNSYFMTYIVSGKRDWITPGKTCHVKEGDSIFIRKGVYTTRQYFDVVNCSLSFFIDEEFIRNFIRENQIKKPERPESEFSQIFELDVNESMRTLFYSIFNYLRMGKDIPRNLVEIKFKELLFNIFLNPKNYHLVQYLTSLSQEGVTNLDNVMMKNFQYDLSLDEFARLSGRSLSAFKRDFKNFYKQTPGKWLTEKRLEFAKSLLINSDKNINEICDESGFKNPSHFNKAFKEKYSLPPRQFRQSNA